MITRTELKTGSVPIAPATAPRAGPSSAPAIAVPEAVPITEPRFSSGDAVISQVRAPDQISAPAIPWTNRVRVEQRDVLGKAEDEAGEAEQQQPGDDRPLRPDPAGDEAGRQRAQQRPRRVGGGEDPGFGLAQSELVDVLRQQGRDRRKEGDVEEDHRRGQDEQPAHPRIQSVRQTEPPGL